MKNVGRSLMAAALLALVAGAPFAASADGPRRGRKGESHHDRRLTVPEFDPASVGVIAAIVAGGGYLIARRRKS